ncbi:MAG: FAD-binding protein [Anaerolineae bacterium]|nr:FAD-binding protein [Anaerolineae bacterium]
MEQITDFANALRPQIAGDVRTDPVSRLLYSTDASNYKIAPLAVVVPKNTDDVIAAVQTAASFGLPILPRGAGTSLAGQAVNACVVIDVSKHIDRVLEVNAEARWARLQPGIAMDVFNRKVAPHGLAYGPDPASGNRATMGGIIANNATGSHSIVYRMTVDHVQEITAVLGDGSVAVFGPADAVAWAAKAQGSSREAAIYRGVGEIVERDADLIRNGYPGVWRRAAGYNLDRLVMNGDDAPRNLASLIVGSEGTLATVIEAKVNLVKKPKHIGLAIFHFDDLLFALRQAPRLLEENLSALELVDDNVVELTRRSPYAALAGWMQGDPAAILIAEVSGDTPAEVKTKLDKVAAIDVGQFALVRTETPKDIADVWAVRKVGLGILMSRPGDYKPVPFIEDAAVPVDQLADYVHDLRDAMAEFGKQAVYYAHASAGVLHIRPTLNLKDAGEIETMRRIARASFELAKKLGGSTSGEHGDGITRSQFNRELYGDVLFEYMVQVKKIFDPDNLFNPDRVVAAPDMGANLRYGPNYKTTEPAHRLYFDWSKWGGYAGAVEMCNGSAECRKLGAGAMCPSFMATREESDSTRGRANMLRAALSGAWPEGLTGKGVKEVLDLCLECKACKSECPSAVDMARLKSEWLAQYHADHGFTLRDFMFGYMPFLSRFATPFAPLVNMMFGSPLVRKPMEWLLGIEASRPFPPFVLPWQTFAQWFNKRSAPLGAPDRPEVVIFADSYCMRNYPHLGKAAVRVLEAMGYRVRLGPDICCGRTLISKGFLGKAKQQGEKMVAAMAQVTDGFRLPVIGIEPSCLLTFRDEYLVLVDDERRRDLAAVSYTIEEFVAGQANGGKAPLHGGAVLRDHPGRVKVHTHCYQKALIGSEPVANAIRAFGYEVEVIDAGCCGMAGSFGYQKEHYGVSVAVGEDRLIPAVRAASDDTLIAAAGVSCRTQIKDLGGRAALHPVELMAAALVNEKG